MEWVNVKDSLPPYNKSVLVLGGRQGMNPSMGWPIPFVTSRIDSKKVTIDLGPKRSWCDNEFLYMNYVTHWCDLPEYPPYESN
jgi:hypothetical protein